MKVICYDVGHLEDMNIIKVFPKFYFETYYMNEDWSDFCQLTEENAIQVAVSAAVEVGADAVPSVNISDLEVDVEPDVEGG